ncbi:MAG TPA: hypothetical protein GXX29_08095 [Firmicutes bacterium]|nr:hypothetical protein [Bacillota bacterium]
MKPLFLLLILLIMTIAAQAAYAKGYYVDISNPAASNLNPGTKELPWKHVPGMLNWSGRVKLQPGDIVYFNNAATWEAPAGTYFLQVQGGVTYDGHSWGPGTRATFKATAPLRALITIMDDHPEYPTVVRGFEIDASGYAINGIGINFPHSRGDLTGAVKRIENCVVHNLGGLAAKGEYVYGIIVSSGYGGNPRRVVANVEILNCVVYNVSRGGINLYSANDNPNSRIENVLVRGNEVYNCGTDPRYAGSSLPVKNHVINAIVENNIIRDPVNGYGTGFSSDPAIVARKT